MCLATAVYFEAGGEPPAGKVAVAQVIMNRVESSEYPDSICDVVTEGKYVPWSQHPVKNQCQFSYWCDGKPDEPQDKMLFNECLMYAGLVMLGATGDIVGGATHYHADYVTPFWASLDYRTVQIGQHIFYARPR